MPEVLSALDRLEIHEVLSRYAWALDTGDEKAFLACFATDAELVWDVFETPGSWRGREALREFIGYFRARPESAGRQHHVSNVLITGSAQGAAARAYVLVCMHSPESPPRVNVMGYYEDELVQENGRWRLLRRNIRDWTGPVLGNIAGQDGSRVARKLPPPLQGLWEKGEKSG